MLEITKNTIIEMKNSFYRLISRLDTTKQRIRRPENSSTENPCTEMQRILELWNKAKSNIEG